MACGGYPASTVDEYLAAVPAAQGATETVRRIAGLRMAEVDARPHAL